MTTVACSDVASSPSDSPSDTAADPAVPAAAEADLEPITAQGVAGVVRDALGPARIASYSDTSEADSVGVMVRLREGRQVLVVTVQVEGEPPVSGCEDLAGTALGAGDCRVTDDGTILAAGVGEAFTDDNTRGSTVLAQSVHPRTGRVVHALYETYSPTTGLAPAEVAEIVGEPDLAAMTAPSTNEAGADISMEPSGR